MLELLMSRRDFFGSMRNILREELRVGGRVYDGGAGGRLCLTPVFAAYGCCEGDMQSWSRDWRKGRMFWDECCGCAMKRGYSRAERYRVENKCKSTIPS